MSIQDEIAADIAEARAAIDAAEPTTVTVRFNGKPREVGIARMSPTDWMNLAAAHSPRGGRADEAVGYNQESLPKDYPADRVTVDGERLEQHVWAGMYEAMEPTHKASIGTVIWGVNVYPAIKEMKELGKATAGKP